MLLLCAQIATASVVADPLVGGLVYAPSSVPYHLDGAPSSLVMSSELPLPGGEQDPLLRARYLKQSTTASTGMVIFGAGSVLVAIGALGLFVNLVSGDEDGLGLAAGGILVGTVAATVGEVMVHVGAIGAAGTLQQMGRGRGTGLGWAGAALRGGSLVLTLTSSALTSTGQDATVLGAVASLGSLTGLIVSGVNYSQIQVAGRDLRVAVTPYVAPSLATTGTPMPGLAAVVVW